MPANGASIRAQLSALDSPLRDDPPRVGMVLAAGHGTRIRSETSKMLHEIWGRPTVERVADAVSRGLDSPNQILVVGIKAEQVAATAMSALDDDEYWILDMSDDTEAAVRARFENILHRHTP